MATLQNSLAGHKALASLLLDRSDERKYDSFQSLYELNSGHESTKVFNKRLVNLSNLPAHMGCKGNRCHSGAYIRACYGTQQNTAKSLDLLRQIIQNSINTEINKIVQKYIDLYFLPAKKNIGLNNETHDVSQEHLQNVCCQILEEAKKMYIKDFHIARCDIDKSECGNFQAKRRKRTLSSGSDSKISSMSKYQRAKCIASSSKVGSGRSTPNKGRYVEPVKREGPKWDPNRMTPGTLFVMGSKANKALGLGATRGRLYIKHPDVFKYAGDQDDKQWLYEKMHMPATGGKAYLLLVDDIIHLSQTDEYRNNPGLMLNELVGFVVPSWMLLKMKEQMEAQRTDRGTRKLIHSQIVSTLAPEVKKVKQRSELVTDSEHSSGMVSTDELSDEGENFEDDEDPQDEDFTLKSHIGF